MKSIAAAIEGLAKRGAVARYEENTSESGVMCFLSAIQTESNLNPYKVELWGRACRAIIKASGITDGFADNQELHKVLKWAKAKGFLQRKLVALLHERGVVVSESDGTDYDRPDDSGGLDSMAVHFEGLNEDDFDWR